MLLLRKLATGLAAALLGPLLIAAVALFSLKATIGQPATVKGWLSRSGVYTHVVDTVLSQSQAAQTAAESNTVPLGRPEVQTAARAAFPPQFLQSATENLIDGTYHWLDGTVAQPDFHVDFGPAKTNLAKNLGAYLTQRIAALPACSRANMPQTFDAFSIQCKPPGIDANAEIQNTVDQVATSPDFLGNPAVTADSFTTSQNGVKQTVFQQHSGLPKLYGWLQRGWWLVGLVSLLAVAAIVVGSPDHRHGWRRVAKTVLASGLALLLGALLTYLALNRINNHLSMTHTKQSEVWQTLGSPLFKQVELSFRHLNLAFGGAFVALGAGLLIILHITGPKPSASPAESMAKVRKV